MLQSIFGSHDWILQSKRSYDSVYFVKFDYTDASSPL